MEATRGFGVDSRACKAAALTAGEMVKRPTASQESTQLWTFAYLKPYSECSCKEYRPLWMYGELWISALEALPARCVAGLD
jgi:hypothetical protein